MARAFQKARPEASLESPVAIRPRTCGNGGLFSFTGFYWSKQIGRYKACVNDLSRTVVAHEEAHRRAFTRRSPAFAAAVNALITPP